MKKGFFVLIVVVLALGAIVYFSTTKPSTNNQANSNQAQPTWKTYQDTEHGFSIGYPATFDDSADQHLASGDFDGLEGTVFKATFPDTYNAGTNLRAVTVFAGAKKVSQAECLKIYGNDAGAYAANPGATGYHTVLINGLTFNAARVSDAGAGNVYTTTRYATMQNDVCFQISMIEHSTNLGILQETEPAITQYDAEPLNAIFEKIVASFKLQ